MLNVACIGAIKFQNKKFVKLVFTNLSNYWCSRQDSYRDYVGKSQPVAGQEVPAKWLRITFTLVSRGPASWTPAFDTNRLTLKFCAKTTSLVLSLESWLCFNMIMKVVVSTPGSLNTKWHFADIFQDLTPLLWNSVYKEVLNLFNLFC